MRAAAGSLAAAAVALLLACAVLLPQAARAESEEAGTLELQVEGAFLVNFVRYTDWPPARLGPPGAPYVLSVVGSGEDVEAIGAVALAAGPVDGRRIEVRRVDPQDLSRNPAGIRQLRAGHVVFVREDAGVRCTTVRRLLDGAPVLTVGDATGFVAAGCMLGLIRVDRHLAFEANPDAIRASGLAVSAKVLKLARIRRAGP